MAESILNVTNEPGQHQKENESNEEDDLLDQKQYEVEASLDGESGFQQQYDNCKKNPKHECFITEHDFIQRGPSCLPEGYRDEQIFEHIKARATLTGRLTVDCVSDERPANYPLAAWKGRNISFPGTGTVVSFKTHYGTCSECKSRSTVCNRNIYCDWEVITARHVVYDQIEADKTSLSLIICAKQGETVVTREIKLSSRCRFSLEVDNDDDQVTLYFSTCNPYIYERLTRSLKTFHTSARSECFRALWENNEYKFNKWVPIVSFPHGLAKQISFGHIKNLTETESDEIEYDTPTCPGSSGAAIFMNDEQWSYYSPNSWCCFHHEGHNRETKNNPSGYDSIMDVDFEGISIRLSQGTFTKL